MSNHPSRAGFIPESPLILTDQFSRFVSRETAVLMTQDSVLFEPHLHVAFNSAGFPGEYYAHNLSQDQVEKALDEIFAARKQIPLSLIQKYHSFLNNVGVGRASTGLANGVCVKPESPFLCRANTNKWSCAGCGLTWVPGSYVGPKKKCKDHPDPWWLPRVADEMLEIIEMHGGPSDSGPIVIVSPGVHFRNTREGRIPPSRTRYS